MIVQITPVGIRNLGWKFWIVFTVFNAAFMPVIYFFYPETGKFTSLTILQILINTSKANRCLEDIDEYYRNNPPLVVIGDKDAIGSKRPLKYVNKEEEDIEIVKRESIVRKESIARSEKKQAGFTSHVE